jgi:hypothetical protein
MRTLRAMLLAVSFFTLLTQAFAQDPGAVAAAAAAANQQAIMQAQMAQQQAQLAQQQALDAANAANAAIANQNRVARHGVLTASPVFSVKPGTYGTILQVKIRDNTRDAVIYYTTDGWTPSTNSARYRGPITLDSTTLLQAIAVGPTPFYHRSLVTKAEYKLTIQPAAHVSPPVSPVSAAPLAAAIPDSSTAAPSKPVLRAATPIHLVFVTQLSSKTADVGDAIEFRVADDVTDTSGILVNRGTPATGVVTAVNRTGAGGAPGELEFEVNFLTVNGATIALRGSAALEGDAKVPGAEMLIPVAGMFTVLRHGKDAEIRSGTPMTATVAADTTLPLP